MNRLLFLMILAVINCCEALGGPDGSATANAHINAESARKIADRALMDNYRPRLRDYTVSIRKDLDSGRWVISYHPVTHDLEIDVGGGYFVFVDPSTGAAKVLPSE